MTLRWRLTLLYSGLLIFLLGLITVSALVLMQRSLLGSLDASLGDTYRLVKDTVSQLALNTPASAAERDQSGILPRVRYLFGNDAIQVEDLSLYDEQSLLDALEAAKTPQQRTAFFNYVRLLQDAPNQRQTIGINPKTPIRLSDAELAQLIESPNGRLILNRDLVDPYSTLSKPTSTPHRVLVVLGPVQLQEATVLEPTPQPGFAITYVGKRLTDVQNTMSALQRVFALLFLTGLILSALGAYFLAGQALRPLRQVRQAAERISGQNLGERVPEPKTHDEVQALAGSLNAMLDRLEESFEAQRRFTSDASHELRTPVTAISGHASYLLRRTSPTGQQQESLKIIQSESERLTNLIGSLLQLARSDSGAMNLTLQPILSGLFLSEIARELAPLATAQNTALTTAGQDIPFEGDPDRLKQVLINLVGNALKAGARTITLESSPQEDGAQVRLSVRDDGPGIPAEHLAKLFDRFYRVEDSRSRDQGGAGLGLSIAKSIVDAHHGKIWLESEVGQGTVAHVQLPVGDVPVLDDEDVP